MFLKAEELCDKLPFYTDWETRLNVTLLTSLTRDSDLTKEEKDWFLTQITTGSVASGPTLGDLKVTQEDFGEPYTAIERRVGETKGAFEALKVLAKMGCLGAIARPPPSPLCIHGNEPLVIPTFMVDSKGNPRQVSDYSARAFIRKCKAGGALTEWLKDPLNQAEWDRNGGRLSFNSLYSKDEKTLSYAGLEDLAALVLFLGINGRLSTHDISGAYYQMMQHWSKLAYQIKLLPVGNGRWIRVLLMTREMGCAHACAVGNTDTAIKIRLADTHAKRELGLDLYNMRIEDGHGPSEYGLRDVLRPYDEQRAVQKYTRKKQNVNSFMHYKGVQLRQYRFGETIRAWHHYQDDFALGHLTLGLMLAAHVFNFFELIHCKLSTVMKAPSETTVICGVQVCRLHFSYERKKWENYREIIDRVVVPPTCSGEDIMVMNGILANTAILFPFLKIALAVASHHFAEQIREKASAKEGFALRNAWKKLKETRYRVDKVVKNCVMRYWNQAVHKRVHAKRFVMCSGDAHKDYRWSTDACPTGVGVVCHTTWNSWGRTLPRTDPMITTEPWGEVCSSTFEARGMGILLDLAPNLKDRTRGDEEVLIRVYQDNEGAETQYDHLNPKLSGDGLATAIYIMERCREKNITLFTDRLSTHIIPADATSRMTCKKDGGYRQELRCRMVLALITEFERSDGELWGLTPEVLAYRAGFGLIADFLKIKLRSQQGDQGVIPLADIVMGPHQRPNRFRSK